MAPFVLNFWFVLNPTWFSTQTSLRIVRWDSTQKARCKSVVVGIQHKQPDLEMSPLRFNTNSPISKCGSLDSTQAARSLNLFGCRHSTQTAPTPNVVLGIQHKRPDLEMWLPGFNAKRLFSKFGLAPGQCAVIFEALLVVWRVARGQQARGQVFCRLR